LADYTDDLMAVFDDRHQSNLPARHRAQTIFQPIIRVAGKLFVCRSIADTLACAHRIHALCRESERDAAIGYHSD
jgi:hypothetical protein